MKATPTIEFTFESPCPGQLENVVALEVEGDDAPRSVATRSHLAGCSRCRAFRDSLRLQNIYVKRWFAANPVPSRGATRGAQREDLGLTPWLNEAMKTRSERELAKDLWRCAAAVYRMDPEVDRQTVFEDQVVQRAPNVAIAEALESMLHAWTDDSRSDSPRSNRAGFVKAAANALVESLDRTDRLEVVSRLLALADDLVNRPLSNSLLLQSEVDWHYGDGRRATTLLEAAYRNATRPIDRHDALNNLSVWAFTRREFLNAERLAIRAIGTTEKSFVSQMNLAIWTFALGDHKRGETWLASAIQSRPRDALPWSLQLTRSAIRLVERGVGRPPMSLEFIADRMQILGSHLVFVRRPTRDGSRKPS